MLYAHLSWRKFTMFYKHTQGNNSLCASVRTSPTNESVMGHAGNADPCHEFWKWQDQAGEGTATCTQRTQLSRCHEAPSASASQRPGVMSIGNPGRRRQVCLDTGHSYTVTSSLTSSLLHRLGKEGRSFLIHTISLMSS